MYLAGKSRNSLFLSLLAGNSPQTTKGTPQTKGTRGAALRH